MDSGQSFVLVRGCHAGDIDDAVGLLAFAANASVLAMLWAYRRGDADMRSVVDDVLVERQRDFLDQGPEAILPLTLREVADSIGVHESTVSRIVNGKYIQTPRGTFELKYFFGSHVATDAGGAASSTAIRALIKQLVAAEDAKAPLSDARISQILAEQGIVVARRTIAKYRESLQIPAVNQRKSL